MILYCILDPGEVPNILEVSQTFEEKLAFLVGGYTATDFLYCSLQLHLAFSEVQVCQPLSSMSVLY